MGILDLFSKGGAAKHQVERSIHKLTHQYIDTSERYAAADRLFEIGSPESLRGLLQRFTFSIDSSIKDADEKEYVHDLLVRAGENAITPILEHLRRAEEAEWPLKALGCLVPEAVYRDHLLELVRSFDIYFSRYRDKKLAVLKLLGRFDDSEVAAAIERFLEDTDDEVRIEAIQIRAQHADDVLRDRLLKMLIEERDRPRVRIAICEIFIVQNWVVRGHRTEILQSLPEGFQITGKGRLRDLRGRD